MGIIKPNLYLSMFLLILIIILASPVYSVVDHIHVMPLNGTQAVPNTEFDYNFTYTNSSDCSNIILEKHINITTNNQGVGFAELDVTDLLGKSIPTFICEERNGVLRVVLNTTLGLFRELLVNGSARANQFIQADQFVIDFGDEANLNVNSSIYWNGSDSPLNFTLVGLFGITEYFGNLLNVVSIDSTNYTFSGDTGLIISTLRSAWVFAYALGVGVDNTGLYFNLSTLSFEYKISGTNLMSLTSQGDLGILRDIIIGRDLIFDGNIDAIMSWNEAGATDFLDINRHLRVTLSNGAYYFNNGVQRILGDGATIFIYLTEGNTNRFIFGSDRFVMNTEKGSFNIQAIGAAQNYVEIYGNSTGYLKVGAGASTSSHGFDNNSMLFVESNLEVDGVAFFDNDVNVAGDLNVTNNIIIGSGEVDVNYTITFDGEGPNDGIISWIENNFIFDFNGDIGFANNLGIFWGGNQGSAVIGIDGSTLIKTLNIYSFQDGGTIDLFADIINLFADKIIVQGNVTAQNVWIPSYIFAHTNNTIPVAVAGVWYNVTFDEEESFKQRMTHTYDDFTNSTFIIVDDGVYDIHYAMSFASANPTPTANIIMRVTKNGVEIGGSLLEEDATKQYSDFTISNGPIVSLVTGDEIRFQFTSDDTDVSLTSHRTFGEHHDTAVVKIIRIA